MVIHSFSVAPAATDSLMDTLYPRIGVPPSLVGGSHSSRRRSSDLNKRVGVAGLVGTPAQRSEIGTLGSDTYAVPSTYRKTTSRGRPSLPAAQGTAASVPPDAGRVIMVVAPAYRKHIVYKK